MRAHMEWRAARDQAVWSPWGIASLAHTHWLTGDQVELPGLAGAWRIQGGAVVRDADADMPSLRIAAGEDREVGELLLRVIERDGALALRVLDPATPARRRISAIASFPYADEWVRAGRFVPDPDAEPVAVTSVDDHVGLQHFAGRVDLEIAGVPVRLAVTRSVDGLSAVFSDGTSGSESYRFRFIRIGPPADDGRVEVDFNRSYLPPCAFSDEYLCQMPTTGNRWSVPIRAGERHVS